MKKTLCILLSAILTLGSFSHLALAKESDYPEILEGMDQATDTYEEETSPLTSYAVKTMQEIFQKNAGNNIVYSPANCYLALCMLCELTEDASRQQLLDLLELNSIDDARELVSTLWEELNQEGKAVETSLGNSIWLHDQLEYKPDPLKILEEVYHASGASVPMGTPEADQAIQEWINVQTKHLLESQAGGLQTDPSTLLMLVSTIYFKDRWAQPFSAASTQEDVFTDSEGNEITTDFMHQYLRMSSYYQDEEKGYKVASLRFQSGNSMRFLLPEEGIDLNLLLEDEEVLQVLLGHVPEEAYKEAHIVWSVPKFDINSDLNLVDDFKTLGLTDVFDPVLADFTPITDVDGVYVDMIEHAGRIKVDEDGCEAAAFTAIGMKATALLPEELEEIEMRLDHPFAFCVLSLEDAALFVGTVNQME